MIRIETLSTAGYNPRFITKEKLEMLKKSVLNDTKFLAYRPILVNRRSNGQLVVFAGNMRLEAIKALGWEEIPEEYVRIVEIPLEQEKMWNIKDNQQYGEYDRQLLAEMLMPIKDNLPELGFDDKETAKLFTEFMDVPSENVDETSDVSDNEEVGNQKSVTCPSCGHSFLP